MTIVSTRDFRANQTKFLHMASQGEHVVLKSRLGRYRLIPIDDEEEVGLKRDVAAEVCQGLKDFRDYLNGDEQKLMSWEELLDELRD